MVEGARQETTQSRDYRYLVIGEKWEGTFVMTRPHVTALLGSGLLRTCAPNITLHWIQTGFLTLLDVLNLE